MKTLKNQGGYVLFPTLIVLSLILVLISTSIDAFVTEKRFEKEIESKLMTDHLLLLAIDDSSDFLRSNMRIGEDGILYYEKGDVYFRIESVNEENIGVLLYASSIKGGKAEASYVYNLNNSQISSYSEQ